LNPIHRGLERLDSRILFPGGVGFYNVFASDLDPLTRFQRILSYFEYFWRLGSVGLHEMNQVIHHFMLLFLPGGLDLEAEYHIFAKSDFFRRNSDPEIFDEEERLSSIQRRTFNQDLEIVLFGRFE
jgi:hypothetical protein